MTRHAKMRRFSKIMLGRFIGYLDRADSDGNNDTSILFHSFICEDFTSCRHVLLQMDQFKYTIIIYIKYLKFKDD